MGSKMRKQMPRLALLLVAVSRGVTAIMLMGIFCGCQTDQQKSLPTWSPSDHDHQASPNQAQVDVGAPQPQMPNLEKHGITDVVLATWKQNCVPCHGKIGRGDGPKGPMFQPRDLSDPSWQRVAIDSEMRHTIKNGRGRMPAFSNIPDETVDGLIRLIRMLGPQQPRPQPSPAPHGAQDSPADSPPAAAQPAADSPSAAAQPATDSPPAAAP